MTLDDLPRLAAALSKQEVVGLNVGISDETRAAMKAIDDGQRAAAMNANNIIVGASPVPAPADTSGWKRGDRVKIEHDGFVGTVLDPYTTLEGKRGWMVQLDGARVVHVYGEKWLIAAPSEGA